MAWIDYARLLGILLVVFGHVLQSQSLFTENESLHLIWNFVYLFHMPLFFIISGYLYKNSLGGVKSLVYSLLIPYLLYQLLFFPASVMMHRHLLTGGEQWGKLLIGMFLGDGYDSKYSFYDCIPCWFLVCIFQLRILFKYIYITHKTSYILIICSLMLLGILRLLHIDLLFCLDSTIMAIPYFIGGYYMKTANLENKKNSSLWCIFFFMFIITIVILNFNGANQMNGPSGGHYLTLVYLGGFTGSAIVYSFSLLLAKLLPVNLLLKIISRNTLFIIFFHWVLVQGFSFVGLFDVLGRFTENIGLVLVETIVISLVILYFSYLIIKLFSNRFPLLFGKSKQLLWK